MRRTSEWYTILTSGGAYNPTPARGPFRSLEDAEQAIENFRGRYGSLAATYFAATNARIAGPFASRAAAKVADISDCTRIVRVVA